MTLVNNWASFVCPNDLDSGKPVGSLCCCWPCLSLFFRVWPDTCSGVDDYIEKVMNELVPWAESQFGQGLRLLCTSQALYKPERDPTCMIFQCECSHHGGILLCAHRFWQVLENLQVHRHSTDNPGTGYQIPCA